MDVDCSIQRPRRWRMWRFIALRPEGMPGFPMPRYFSKGLAFCSGRPSLLMRVFFFSGRSDIP